MEDLKDGDIAPIIDDGVDETPEEETPMVEEPKPTVSKEKFDEIDKARRAFYEENKRLKRQLGEKSVSSPTIEVIKIAKKLEKYTEEEINSLSEMIKSDNPRDIVNALDNPLIKSGIEAERQKVAKQNQMPSPSQAGSSSFEKAVTKQTSPEDVDRILEERFRKAQQGKSAV